MIVGVLAASCLAVPAWAGSTGVKGGQVVSTTRDDSTRSYAATVTGTLTVNGCWGQDHGYSVGTTVYRSGKIATDYSNPADDANVAAHIRAAENTVDSIGARCAELGDRGTYYGHSTSHSTSVKDDRYTYWETDGDSSSVVVGDPDAFNTNYVAQGTVTRTNVTAGNLHTDHYYRVNGSGYVSPIVLDLDGDGKIEASNGNYLPHSYDFSTGKSKTVMFDFYGNGFPVAMEWVGAHDGLLCRPQADGSITGANLFGVANGHQDGFEELATLDTNRDGLLQDAELEGLSVWTDKNGNGMADENEVSTVQELGITSISVNHNNFKSSFVRNGQKFMSADWWPCVVDVRKVDLKSI